ncbi:hypothetical protein M758_7G078000 [Ceratodon purpureus]|nr:hypothetical protein M758_7G078000 [Ceratodon purpureus]
MAGRSIMGRLRGVQVLAFVLGALLVVQPVVAMDYASALEKSLLYFEAQRSGKLPSDQRVSWRGDSALNDGQEQGIDLTGGYYDAGDNVKYGLPMAFTVSMLSWSVIEYRHQLQQSGQLDYALQAIRWGTDYFIKAHPSANVLWGEVGDGDTDHQCWMRPEDMTTSRTAYKIDANNPGSDLAGETAAAMASASIVFKASDPSYSATLLTHARQLFTFADTYRGTYHDSIPIAKKYYQSWSGYNDELLWGAIWLYEATGEAPYLQYVIDNAASLGGTGWALDQFSWDNKYVGVQLKATKILLSGKGGSFTSTLEAYRVKAEYFLCGALQKNSGAQFRKSPGGMFWIQDWNNMQYVTTSAFLLTVASDYYEAAHATLKYCTSSVTNAEMLAAGKEQVDYVLGKNGRGTSYLVGFGASYPQRVHHRAASLPQPVACKEGFERFYYVQSSNPHVIEGAITGGPDANDNYNDQRDEYAMAEPCTYNTAPMVGVFARLSVGSSLASSLPDSSSQTITPLDVIVSSSSLASLQEMGIQSTTHESRLTRSHPIRKAFSGECIAITQHLVEKWAVGRHVYFKNAGKVTNNCKTAIQGTTFVVHGLYGTLWGLEKVGANGNIYTLPHTMPKLAPGQSLDFSYVQQRPFKAQIFVRKACPTCKVGYS